MTAEYTAMFKTEDSHINQIMTTDTFFLYDEYILEILSGMENHI